MRYSEEVRGVLIAPPASFLEERRRLGHDVRDEMWDGVVHVVPQPGSRHQRLAHMFGFVLLPLAEAHGLVATHETGLYRPGTDRDWRVPDLLYAPPDRVSERGVEGHADLVVEFRSPDDETYEKLPFYAEVGCREVLVIDADSCAVELFSLEVGSYGRTEGRVRLISLAATIERIEGPGLRVAWQGGSADVVV
jgi:Uma2 family endonuclease